MIADACFLLLAAILLDIAVGDPEKMPHPVRWIGALIVLLEKILYGRNGSRLGGVLLTTGSVLVVAGVVYGSLRLLSFAPLLRALLEIYFLYAAIAWRSLKDESRAVAERLRHDDLTAARIALSRIVGRDTQRLDEPAIVRATVETVGENAIDGVFSAFFYMMIGFALGCPAVLVWAFKTVSTLDSMVGYKNERYLRFGWFSARCDDVLNFIPARLGAFFLLLGAAVNGYRVDGDVVRGVMRDRLRHSSPNSAHGESVMAWTLGIELGGDSEYGGVMIRKPVFGVAARAPERADIARTHAIMDSGVALFLLACLALALPKIFLQGG